MWWIKLVGSKDDALFKHAQALRIKTFVQEQGVPQHLEMDAIDDYAVHYLLFVHGTRSTPVHVSDSAEMQDILAKDNSIKCAACLRIFPKPNDPTLIKVGRFAVDVDRRGEGLGRLLWMQVVEQDALAHFHPLNRFYLHSQYDKKMFYFKCGFTVMGTELEEHVFEEDGIMHVAMTKTVLNTL